MASNRLKEIVQENYYSNEINNKYMSYSQFKSFKDCEAKALAELKGEYVRKSSTSQLVGSYVDSWLDGEEEHKRFLERNHDLIYTKKGELRADFVKAEQIIEFAKKDDYFLGLLKGKRQVILTGTIAGVPFKAKLDSLLDDCIVDGKVMKDCADVYKNGERLPFWKAYGYDYQAAIYQDLVIQNFGIKLPFKLVVITKEDIPDKRIFEFTDETIQKAHDEIVALAPRFQEVKMGLVEPYECCECDYCKSKKLMCEELTEKI